MKKILCFVLLLMMLVSSFGITSYAAKTSEKFSDLSSTHWANQYVAAMVSNGSVNGYADGTFKPSKNVTRAEWAKLLTYTADIPLYDSYEEVIDNSSLDVFKNDWYAQYIVSMIPFFGFEEDGSFNKLVIFRPNEPATRLEIVKSIVVERGYDLTHADYSLVSGFKDYRAIPADDVKYAAVAVEKGLIKGFEDNTFRPNDSVTRAEACAILYRAYLEAPVHTKPYSISTLVSANIDDPIMATVDNSGNLFYIDNDDNCVYKVDLKNRKKVKYFDPDGLKHETDEDDSYKMFSSYVAKQVYYDATSGRLILNGTYTSLSESGKKPVSDGKFTYMYDITGGHAKLFCVPSFSESKGYWCNLQTFIDDDTIFVGGTYEGKVDIETGEREYLTMGHGNSNDMVIAAFYRNNLYYLGGKVYKYDYSEDQFEDIVDDVIFSEAYGYKDGYYYFMGLEIVDRDDDTKFYKFNVATSMFEELDITLDTEKTDYTDARGVSDLSEYFYVVDDNTFIFYDYNAEAFRVLEKTADTADVVNPYRVDSRFYEPYENPPIKDIEESRRVHAYMEKLKEMNANPQP